MSFGRPLVLAAALFALGACAGGQPEPPAPPPRTAPGAPPPAVAPGAAPRVTDDQAWPVKTRYVLDLWLHGFALLSDDSSRIPLFRTGYRDRMIVEKNKLRIITLLDSKHDSLANYLNTHSALASAQFIPLYEHEWDELQSDIKIFLMSDGNPRKGKGQEQAQMIAFFAQSFPGAADRRWLATFFAALQDEDAKFYRQYWHQTESAQRKVLIAVDSIWARAYARRLRRFQSSSNEERGEILLSLPIGAEGRSVLGGKRQNSIAVLFPDVVDSAAEAIYVIAHEAVGNVAGTAVGDNTTPVQKRNGMAEKFLSIATVRGGEMLVTRVAPELSEGYMAFYLRAAGVPFAPGQERPAFREAFPLPDVILDAMRQAMDATTTGI